MKINYKFNKSSEARDCIISGVELTMTSTTKVSITEEELYVLNSEFDEDYQRYIIKDFNYDTSDLDNGRVQCKVKLDLSTRETVIKGTATHVKTHQDNYFEDIALWKELINQESKQFTSPSDLKSYIQSITEPIEFVTNNPLDEIILKEWIGEWKTQQVLNEYLGRDYTYFETVFVGSPTLNSNWTFKIER